MKRLTLAVTIMIACAAPARALDPRPDPGCEDPSTTGALPTGTVSAGARPARIAVTPPEESWQAEARADAERRRREEAEGCPTP